VLKSTLDWLAALAHASDDAIIGSRLDRTITYWNEAATRLYGYTEAEMIGNAISRLLDDKDELDMILARLVAGEVIHLHAAERIHKNGTRVHVDITNSPIRLADGTIVGAATVARDATQRLATERERDVLRGELEQAKRTETLGVIAGGVAHDFNNLMTAVLGNATLLKESSLGQEERNMLREIEISAQRAAQLTQLLLDYAGKTRRVVTPVDLAAATRGAIERRGSDPRIRFESKPADDMDEIRVLADLQQLERAIASLLTNALEASSERVTISIRHCRVDADRAAICALGSDLGPGDYGVVEVTDTGEGMDEETQERIFDPFFSTKFQGRGLELAAVSGITKASGGGIVLESNPGSGTRIALLFPMADADN
jgi:two-component system, cell cycle sensor histidine kinase and response regulator CckA